MNVLKTTIAVGILVLAYKWSEALFEAAEIDGYIDIVSTTVVLLLVSAAIMVVFL